LGERIEDEVEREKEVGTEEGEEEEACDKVQKHNETIDVNVTNFGQDSLRNVTI